MILLYSSLAAALSGQGFLAWRLGEFSAYRMIIMTVCLAGFLFPAVLKKRARLPALLFSGVLASGAFWLTTLELWLRFDLVLARGLLFVVAAALAHSLLISLASTRRKKPSRSCRIYLGILLTLTVSAWLLFSVECAMRLACPLNLYEIIPDNPVEGPCLIETEGGRLVLRPGFKGEYRHPEFPGNRIEINAYGFRDGLDEACEPEAGDASVLVLGDSLAFGTGVSLEETFHERLEASAGEILGRPLRVYSAAVPGYGQFTELGMFDECASRTRPDVVIVALYEGNDFSDNLLAEMVAHDLLPAKAGQEKPQGEALGKFMSGVVRWKFWKGSSSTIQVAANKIGSFLAERGFGERFVPVNKFLIRCLSRDGDPYTRLGRTRTVLLLNGIRERCSKTNAELLVLIIPALVQVDQEIFAAFSSQWARGDPDRFDRLRFHQTFISQLEEEAFCVVDMMDRLEAETAAGRPCYHAEGHWNAHGHAVAAEELAPILSELLKAGSPR